MKDINTNVLLNAGRKDQKEANRLIPDIVGISIIFLALNLAPQ
jgi:hypothetical protein